MNKKILFLIILVVMLIPKIAHADQYKFYEAEYIPNIYLSKYNYATNTIFYQQARFFRNQKTEEEVYCIEPFNIFNEHSFYDVVNTPRDISPNQLKRIKQLAYFGYKYNNHTDQKWYAITQLMIWKAAFPNEGDYYFTDSLNGRKTSIYENEIKEIEALISDYNNPLPINNQTINVVEGKSVILDQNKDLSNFYTDNKEISIDNTRIIINPLVEGTYSISINRNNPRAEKTPLIYQAINSQNMTIRGDLESEPINFKINVIKTNLTIIKEDEDTKAPQGEASLDGTTFNIYNENNEFIREVIITDGTASVENLDFGKYYIQEKSAGAGYLINSKKYGFEINEKNTNITLTVKNKVIEKKIRIIKKYGINNNYKPEPNIVFNIFNQKDELIKSVTTNEDGEVEIILPYGKYKIIQENTTEGYTIHEDIEIVINNSEDETIELYDYKIDVPNTSKNSLIKDLLSFIKNIFKKTRIKTIKTSKKNIIGKANYINVEKPIGRIIINKLNLNQCLYDIDSKNNNVNKNVTILKGSNMPDEDNGIIVIAAHSGDSKISYFNNLDKLEINDEITIEYQEKKYNFIVHNKYELPKNGSIYGEKKAKKQLVLTTCYPNKPSAQLVINCIEKNR